MTTRLRIGIDLGGTKTEGAAIDATGSMRARRRITTPAGDYRATIATIVAVVAAIEQELRQPELVGSASVGSASVGIGMPGAISPATGLVKNANSTWLIGRPLQRDLEAALARPVRLANDANCFALSEAVDGAAAGCKAGRLARSSAPVSAAASPSTDKSSAAPLRSPASGGTTRCPGLRPAKRRVRPVGAAGRAASRRSCRVPGLAADHRRHTGQSLDPPAIAAAAARGDPDCRTTLARYGDRLARGLASVINLIDPDAIVLGGGLSAIGRLYDEVPRSWARYVFSDRVRDPPAGARPRRGERGARCRLAVAARRRRVRARRCSVRLAPSARRVALGGSGAEQRLCGGKILGPVGVEERIERLGRRKARSTSLWRAVH